MRRTNRREILVAGIGGALASGAQAGRPPVPAAPSFDRLRRLFPGVEQTVFLNAAGGTPLGAPNERGLKRYLELQRPGAEAERREQLAQVVSGVRERFAELIGARASEIGLVHCTKAGEQVVMERLAPLWSGGNLVTNDLHFVGSLHNLVGLRGAGMDVRIVRAEHWRVDPQAMAEAIDERTALVSVSLVSNINGHLESIRELAAVAHEHGALLYADVIQAAGIVPIDVRGMGIDFAACSAYKWLLGVHGIGFLYVAEEHQGTVLVDRSFPGTAGHNYPPWTDEPDRDGDDLYYRPPSDAGRYQPGHVGYLGYSGLHESLDLLRQVGVEAALDHSVRLNRRLIERLDGGQYVSISPHVERSPIATFKVREPAELRRRLQKAQIVVALAGDRLRISPALYNNESDIDRLAEVLSG